MGQLRPRCRVRRHRPCRGRNRHSLVLDAGCGTGRLTTPLAKLRVTPIGVDVDPNMLSIAARRLPGRCLRATIEHLPFPNATFDLAIAVTVLDFVADPTAAVAELVRVTRPGGRIVIGALNPHSPWGLANRRRLRSGAWCDARFFSRQSFRELGQPHGRTRPAPLTRPRPRATTGKEPATAPRRRGV